MRGEVAVSPTHTDAEEERASDRGRRVLAGRPRIDQRRRVDREKVRRAWVGKGKATMTTAAAGTRRRRQPWLSGHNAMSW